MRRFVLALVALATLASVPAPARDPKINSLASLTALRALSPQAIQGGRQDGDLAVVTDTGGGVTGLYQFSQSSAAAASGVIVIQPTTGSGRWLLVSSSAASAVTGLSAATPVAITSTAAVGTGTTAARADHAHAHGAVTTGASSHDADQLDLELADGSKKQIGAASDTVEAALSDIDAAFGAAVSTLTTTSKLLVGAINELDAALGVVELHFTEAIAATGAKFYLKEATDNGVNFVTILGAAAMGANYTLTMDLAASVSMSTIVSGAADGAAAKVVTDAMLSVAGVAGAALVLAEPVAGGLSDFTLQCPALTAPRAITLTDRDYNLTTIADQADLGVTNAATAQSTANAALPKAGGQITGNITCAAAETFDGVDVSTLPGLISTAQSTADAALPKAGGQITGNITCAAAETFDGVDVSTLPGLITTAQTTADNALPKAGGEMSGNITFAGAQTVDGRDVSADGSQLDTAYLARVQKVTKTTSLAGLGASPVNVAFDAALPAGGVPLFATMLVTTKGTMGAGGSYIKVSVGGDGGGGNPAISTVMGQMNVESTQGYPAGTTLRGSTGTLLGWVPAETPNINIEYDGAAPTAGSVTINLYYVVVP